MGVLYGLASAVLWGTADFFARLAAERVGTRRTVFYMQCAGTLCMALVMLVPAAQPTWPSSGVVLFAMGLGLVNVCGGSMLYRALEIGTVSLVSPVSSTFAAVAVVLAIGIAGERPAPWQLAGLVCCAIGVIGASIPPRKSDGAPASRRGIGLAALAALFWGVSFFALRYVVKDLGAFFPVLISRGVSAVAVGAVSLAQRKPLPKPTGAWRFVVGVAVFDSAAFVFYNLGVATQLTSVVAVLSSLFAAWTVLLAMVFLRERLGRMQWAAVAVIFLGVALVSAGG